MTGFLGEILFRGGADEKIRTNLFSTGLMLYIQGRLRASPGNTKKEPMLKTWCKSYEHSARLHGNKGSDAFISLQRLL